MGTTKLTRKEILAEDPVHEAIMRSIEFVQVNGKKIAFAAVGAVLLGLGIYGGLQYLDSSEMLSQEQLGKGIEFFHAQIAPDATENPYGKGSTPTFQNETLKYQAAAKEFSSVVSRSSYSKAAIVARYYLGLAQLHLGQQREAVQNLESVAGNSKNRFIMYLAKKALATNDLDTGNYKGAAAILDSILKDPQYDLPKEDVVVLLARAMNAQGKHDEAIKLLRETSLQSPGGSALKFQVEAELNRLQKASKAGQAPAPAHP